MEITEVEEVKSKRPLITTFIPMKKARLETPIDVQNPNDEQNGKGVYIPMKYLDNLALLVDPETDQLYAQQIAEVTAALKKFETTVKAIQDTNVGINKQLERAKTLLSIPIPDKFLKNKQQPRLNGLHHPISSQNKLLPYPAPKETPATDGIQILSCISGRVTCNLPPVGQIKRLEPALNAKVFAMKIDLFNVWYKATIVDIKESVSGEKIYRVKFDNFKFSKSLTAKQIAHEFPCEVRLPFGKRIVAFYKPEDNTQKPALYAGLIAEPPKSTNRHRYLVFFDDGFAQYIDHTDIRLVYFESKEVWEDIHPASRDFIKSYYEKFPERPMLKLQKNQIIRTEFHSRWWHTKVIDIDASMVKMFFVEDKRYEWIYRGSTRLQPLYDELEKAKHNRLIGKVRRHNIPGRKGNENAPYVEYTGDEIVLDSGGSDSEVKNEPLKSLPKNTARKSTATAKKPEIIVPTTSTVKLYEGEVVCVKERFDSMPIKYVQHCCGKKCKEVIPVSELKGENPLRKPMCVGWERHSRKFKVRICRMCIHYRTPCGRMLRAIEDVNDYLILVKSDLTIDMFSFDPLVCPYKEFVTSKDQALWSIPDIALGQENVTIECVNCLTNQCPPNVEYAAARFPGTNVNLNLDEEFLCGCDCEDNCQDPMKCQCRRLTIRPKSDTTSTLGYNHRRLSEPIVTGIYECNPRCKCSQSCTNRVVQNGIQIRLQMFKTLKKGWGIRCLDDVDAGTFLCIYAGQLMTEQGAEESGNMHGDEYLAELDHIEVAENCKKEGYESDVDIDIDVEADDDDDDEASNHCDEKKTETTSDGESDVSSTKSSSYSSQSSNGLDSDPEYEAPSRRGSNSSMYITRSQRAQTKKRVSLFSTNEFDLDADPKAGVEVKSEKKELPDLEAPSIPQNLDIPPLSPTTAEQISKLHINRKPKIEGLNSVDDTVSSRGVNAKKSQNVKTLSTSSPMEKQIKEFVGARSYFGEACCYIMNAKTKGNIGRYLNHSCSPNSFVQNVFYDSHDLRFPTVAFFANDRIPAGTELTWDYNYEVGSVENKALRCHCESKNCRGRLI